MAAGLITKVCKLHSFLNKGDLFENGTLYIDQREENMAIFNKDEAEGKWEKVKGTVKDKAGELTGDRELEAEGEAQKTGGEAQETWGKFKRGVSETVDSFGEAISNTGKKVNR